MPVTQGDLVFKRAQYNDDAEATNGGRITQTDVGSNLLPDVNGQERQDGLIRFRKFFFKNENNSGGYTQYKLYSGKLFLKQVSPAGDMVLLKTTGATATDLLVDHNASWKALSNSSWCGVGYLRANPTEEGSPVDYIATNKTSCVVVLDGAYTAGSFFFPGTAVITDDAGKLQFITIASVNQTNLPSTHLRLVFSTTPTNYQFDRQFIQRTADNGTYTTENQIGAAGANLPNDGSLVNRLVYIDSGTGAGQIRRVITNNALTHLVVEHAWNPIPLNATFSVLKTMISMCADAGDIQAAYSNFSKPNGRTFTESYLKTFPVGTIDDAWTVRVLTVTAPGGTPLTVSINGTATGALLYGGVNSWPIASVKPPNAMGQSYYFEIQSSAWGSGWYVNDDVMFNTVSASKGAWIREEVTAGTNSHLNNSWEIGCAGDTV